MKENIISILKERIEQHQKGIDRCVSIIKDYPNEESTVAAMAHQMDKLRERQKECEMILWHVENLKNK